MLDTEFGGGAGQPLDAIALGQPLADDLPPGAGSGTDQGNGRLCLWLGQPRVGGGSLTVELPQPVAKANAPSVSSRVGEAGFARMASFSNRRPRSALWFQT